MTSALDFADLSFVRDPYPALADLRAHGRPVFHEDLNLWLAARHSDADAVLRNRSLGRVFVDRQPEELWETFNWLHADSILDSEPPKHTRLKSLVAKVFTRSYVESMRPRVEQLTAGLLDDCAATLADTGSFDLIGDYAEPLPVLVIAELLGVPQQDRYLLRPWSQAIVRMYEYKRTPELESAARQACSEFADYVAALANDRRGGEGTDLISHLARVEEQGERLTEHELVATCVLLLNAGHEASVNGFGNGMVALFNHPEQFARLVASPAALAASAVEEFLRYDSPLHLFERTATADVEIGGVFLQAGDRIAALLGAANRDDTVFANPDVMDIGRDPNPHLAFGGGIHFCLGAPLARLELTISLPALLQRFATLTPTAEPHLRPTFVLRGYESIPVRA